MGLLVPLDLHKRAINVKLHCDCLTMTSTWRHSNKVIHIINEVLVSNIRCCTSRR